MNEKIIRYMGFSIGVLFTLVILYINDALFYNYLGYKDFFASSVKKSMIYNFILDALCGNYRRGCFNNYGTQAYVLWFLSFIIGTWISWKYRFKTAKLINKIHTKI